MKEAETHVSVHSSHHTPPELCSGGSFLKVASHREIVTICVERVGAGEPIHYGRIL